MTASRGPNGTGGGGDGTAVATYSTYREAERAVDHLSDHGFPVERAAIVGRDLRLVERVTGRVDTKRAALNGAMSGAFVGFLIGWIFGLFDWTNPVLAAGWLALNGIWIGALLGALMGVITHALTGGRRDFSSVGGFEADRYELVVDRAVADEAQRLLAELSRPAREPTAAS